MSDKEVLLLEIEGFFKTKVYLQDLAGILDNPPSSLIGVDNISGKNLISNGINSIRDLSEIPEDKLHQIPQVPPTVLKKWIGIAKLISKVLAGKGGGGGGPGEKGEKKVIMVGLDNAGKTSLLNVMKGNFSALQDILPTKGVQREQLSLFGFPIISWDLGGQVQFRENWYFEKPELYFTEASLMIYVIDIQDNSRFPESGAYLTHILEILRALGENIPILIVLNKSDPGVVGTPQWEENIKILGEAINPILDSFGFSYDYAMTSIYQTDTVTQMFSTSLQKFSATTEIIKSIINEYGTSFNAEALSLISTEGMIFASFSKNETSKDLLNDTAVTLFTLEGFYKSKGLFPENTMIYELPNNNLIIRGEKLFDYLKENVPVFLWLLSNKTVVLDDKIEQIKKELYPLVRLLM